MPRFPAFILLGLVLLCGCASGGSQRPEGRERYNPRVITTEEMQGTTARNAFELVQLLRPGWLQKKGAYSFRNDGDIVVYMDDMRVGGPDALRQIETSALSSIRFLDPVSAQARFGLSHNYGAIQVIARLSR